MEFTADTILVNSVNPGTMSAMKTAMLRGGLEVCRVRAAAITARREGNCQGVAYVILLLASDAASYITGVRVFRGWWLDIPMSEGSRGRRLSCCSKGCPSYIMK